MCHAVQDGNDGVVICSTNRHICPCADVGLWVAMGTGIQLCYIPAHWVYSSLGPDQSKVLTSFYTFPGCDTIFSFSERINKWLASKLINSETFLPRTNTLPQSTYQGCAWALSEQQPALCCVAVAEDVPILASQPVKISLVCQGFRETWNYTHLRLL